MRGTHWEPWENLFLYEVAGTMPVPVIAEKLERSEAAICRKALRLEIKLISRSRGRPWTQAELYLFGRFSLEEIAQATGRPLKAIRTKRNALARSGGLTMREWSTEELALLRRHKNAE